MPEQQDHLTSLAVMKRISELLDAGTVAVLVTAMSGPIRTGAKLLIDQAGNHSGTLGDGQLDMIVGTEVMKFIVGRDDTRAISLEQIAPQLPHSNEIHLLFERLQPVLRLIICGAGHVGAALAKLGAFVGYQITLIDDRREFLEAALFEGLNIALVLTENWEDDVARAVGNGKGTAVAVVTRGHSEDELCLRSIVNANPDYVGLIGSKRRTAIVINRLRESGASEDFLNQIRAPIGLDIGAVTPEEVALAIISEIVAERHHAAGGPLSPFRRPGKS
ncbi:MAG TPA: XdhC family protein [Pyrinomonadaceae bacterium]|nr:XdhC family protein [Pyrinomonadaceae bacterium]